jgi:hypothetical protein
MIPSGGEELHTLVVYRGDMVFSIHGFMNFSNPALRTLVPTIGVAYAFQVAVAIPNVYFQEDRFYGKYLNNLDF